jgi:hypothetical protein
MKNGIAILFLIIGFSAFAQKKTDVAKVQILKSKVLEAKSIKSLIVLPKGCKVSGFLLTVKHASNYQEFQCKGEVLVKEAVAALKKVNPGSSFFIEKVKASCKGVKKKYEIAVK